MQTMFEINTQCPLHLKSRRLALYAAYFSFMCVCVCVFKIRDFHKKIFFKLICLFLLFNAGDIFICLLIAAFKSTFLCCLCSFPIFHQQRNKLSFRVLSRQMIIWYYILLFMVCHCRARCGKSSNPSKRCDLRMYLEWVHTDKF